LSEPVADEEHADGDGDGEGDEGGAGADAEDCADREVAFEDEEEEQGADDAVDPDGVDGGLGVGVDVSPVAGEGEAFVAGVSLVGVLLAFSMMLFTEIGGVSHISHTRCSYHATLAHSEASNDGEREHGKHNSLWEDVIEESGEWLAQIALQHGCDVDDSVSHH
jgi:hypothetical protein